MTIRIRFRVVCVVEVDDELAQIRYHPHEPLEIFLTARERHFFDSSNFLCVRFDAFFGNKLTKEHYFASAKYAFGKVEFQTR